jgi:hypothetical protein
MCLLLHQGCLKIVLLIPLSAHTDTPRSLVLPDGVHQSGHYPPAIGTFGNAWEEILRRKQVPPRVLRISSHLRDYGIHGSYTPSDDGHSESTQSSFSSPPSLTSEDGMSHPSQREACVNNIYLQFSFRYLRSSIVATLIHHLTSAGGTSSIKTFYTPCLPP